MNRLVTRSSNGQALVRYCKFALSLKLAPEQSLVHVETISLPKSPCPDILSLLNKLISFNEKASIKDADKIQCRFSDSLIKVGAKYLGKRDLVLNLDEKSQGRLVL